MRPQAAGPAFELVQSPFVSAYLTVKNTLKTEANLYPARAPCPHFLCGCHCALPPLAGVGCDETGLA